MSGNVRWRRILDSSTPLNKRNGNGATRGGGGKGTTCQTPAAPGPSLGPYARQFGLGSRLKKSNQKGEAGGKEAAQSRSPGSLMIRLLTA